jgi:hypothetical protein
MFRNHPFVFAKRRFNIRNSGTLQAINEMPGVHSPDLRDCIVSSALRYSPSPGSAADTARMRKDSRLPFKQLDETALRN